MADNGIIGNGSKVGYRVVDSPLGVFTRIGQLLNVNDFELAADKVNTTVHSTNRFKRSMPGMFEVSPLELELLANPDELSGVGVAQEALIDLLLAGTTVNWGVETPVDRTQSSFKRYEFDGYVRAWKHGKPIEDRQTYMFTIEFDDDTFTIEPAGASEIS